MILGGDGFCGWPASLYFSSRGHEVVIVDNLVRRKTDIELEADSLTPISSITERIEKWNSITGKKINFYNIDVALQYDLLLALILDAKPDVVVHYAEQRSAPYSMKTSSSKRYTVNNNVNTTNNLLCAIVESKLDIHVVHLGTMGVYGYGVTGDMPIPEGYINVSIKQPNGEVIEREIMHPASPGSIYHTTKTMDAMLFYFYNSNNGIRVTDLHQGVVWGTNTEETLLDKSLMNRFDYDGDYGTVLNRFLMQASIGYPLTVHGTGGQTRAFIHIKDSVRCVELAILNPPSPGARVEIFNQMTETHRVRDLAKKVSNLTGVEIQYLDNPRVEDAENELVVQNEGFLNIGLKPTTLDDTLMLEIRDVAMRYIERVDQSKIIATSKWR